MGKHKHLKIMSFLNILREAKIHTISQTSKVSTPKYLGLRNISRKAETHTISRTWKN